MDQKRKRYSEEFRRKTIEHLEETKKSLTQLSRELDIGVTTLSNWKQTYSKEKKDQSTQPLVDYDRLKRLEQQNRELQEENEILKKAMHFFTKNRD
ncbi:transposase [Paenibacillus sp. ATY16]|uniref:transposase n=1 Tax=Paenibacillus sp. ATY16 TaxID=1759312 RepID=UPI00200F5CD8|nr:transposase [Paenibacillus sp. ATY16]MCK9858086.1 transposase [Paenibacillus sp. ATY16]